MLKLCCWLYVGFVLTIPTLAMAATHTAQELTPAAVLAAIRLANDGDTVQLPAGTAVWSRGWNTGAWLPMKAITIQGAGIDRTIIIDNTSTSYGDEPFWLKGVEGKPFRITGITFQGWDGEHYRDAGSWSVINIEGACKDWRIDHCRFLNLGKVIQITGDTCGLIDHCSFEPLEIPPGRLPQLIFVRGPGASAYKKPLTLGTANAVYIEDCIANYGAGPVNRAGGNVPWVVPYDGARVVIRHNKIINSQLEIYRPAMAKGQRGSLSAEIYDNEFSAVGLEQFRPQGTVFIAGGTGVIFNNTISGSTYNVKCFSASNERSCRSFEVFGKCDGTSPYDGNQIPAGQPGAGYPSMDQPGRGVDLDGDGVQEPAPWYEWNNTLNGSNIDIQVRIECPAVTNHLIAGRDFFNNTPMPGYKPYAYPHPLQEPLRRPNASPAEGGPSAH